MYVTKCLNGSSGPYYSIVKSGNFKSVMKHGDNLGNPLFLEKVIFLNAH